MPAIYFDVYGERGRIGKSTVANFLRDSCEMQDVPVQLVRIESRLAAPAVRDTDICLFTEDLEKASKLRGGVAAALDPLWRCIEASVPIGGVSIGDWPAGSGSLRARFFAATGIAALARDEAVRPVSIVVTTADASVMAQARDALGAIERTAPEFERVLVLNEFGGDFNFDHKSEQRARFDELLETAGGIPIVIVPLVEANSWDACRSAGMSMPEAMSTSTHALAARLDTSVMVARAIKTHISNWWISSEEAFLPVFRGPRE